MGRSVETPQYALITAYAYWSEDHTSMCSWCDQDVKGYTGDWELAYPKEGESVSECPDNDSGHSGWDYDSDNFDNDLEWVTDSMKDLWPSLYETDRWSGRETRVFLANDLVEISVSEYCGTVALCVSAVTDEYGNVLNPGLSARWAKQIEPKFQKFFGTMSKIGTFSDGTSVYQKG